MPTFQAIVMKDAIQSWHPRFCSFNSVIPTDVVRVKPYVNGLLNQCGSERIVFGLVSVF